MFDVLNLLPVTGRFLQGFDNQRGPTLGAKAEVAATSPPTALRMTILISLGSNLGGMLNFRNRFYDNWRTKNF